VTLSTTARPTSPPDAAGPGPQTPFWILAIVLSAAAALILWAGREVAVIGDMWPWVFGVVHPSAETFVRAYNGHLLATTWGLYYGLLATFGLPEYWVYRVVALLFHLAVVVLVYLLARRRVGPWGALLPAAAIAFLGTGSDVFLSGLNVGIAAATVACLAALAVLDRHTRGSDIMACGLLIVGLASFTSAVAWTAGVYAEVLWQRDRWRRIWVALVPTVLYVTWWGIWGGSGSGDLDQAGSLFEIAGHTLEVAAGSVAGVAGIQLASPTLQEHFPWLNSLAQVVIAIGFVAFVWLLIRRRYVSPRMANLVASALVLWLLVALGRGAHEDLTANRYVYMGAVIVILIGVELATGLRLRGALAWAAVLAVATTVVLNVAWMVIWGNHLRRESTTARAELAALDIVGDRARPDFHPSHEFRIRYVNARRYFSAVHEFGGSPAMTTADLRAASAANREAADRVLVRGFPLHLVQGASRQQGPVPTVEDSRAARINTTGSCLWLTPKDDRATVEIVPRSAAGVVLETSSGARAAVRARRFGEGFEVRIGALEGGPATIATPLGHAPDRWDLQVVAHAATRICGSR
jgi:hypothetical protein